MFSRRNYKALILALFGTIAGFGEAREAKPNIVIILVDDMGYGDPGCFNPDSKIATPNIDSLAIDGMRFTDAHAPGPLCHMSRYGLLTGRYPFRTDVMRWKTEPLIEPGQMTIASHAKSQGYRTAMVGKWHVGFKENGYDRPLPGGPVDCGFDTFFGMRASTDIPPYFYIRDDRVVEEPTNHIEDEFSESWSKIQGRRRLAGGIAPNMKLEQVLPRFTNEAINAIKRHTARANEPSPLMLYLAYPAPHTPWLPSKEFRGKSGADMYGDFVMMVDAQIGRVLKALQEAGMEEDTLVIFTSDNGPCWFDEDVERLGHDSAGGLRGMKADAWEAGHRMPFVVRWPGIVKAGSVSDQTICFTDLLATFAAMTGTVIPDDAGPDSFSFLPVLTGEQFEDIPIRPSFVMRAGSASSMMTIRSGDWKLITGLGSGGFSKPKQIKPGPGEAVGQLYNLAMDRGETTNLYAKHPEIVVRLKAEMKKIVESGRSRATAAAPKPSLPVVDTSTLSGKVMCGYQGWFNCPGDGMELGWVHWGGGRRKEFGPESVTVDLWPDVSELGSDERFATGFKHADGRVAEVFSSANGRTVARHFEWMCEYGIDGAFLQRFANGLKRDSKRRHKDKVLSNVREGARQSGRAYAVMYDLTGLAAGGVDIVRKDWEMLRRTMRITEDDMYLHHEGKPVVTVWGVGFGGDEKERRYSLSECRALIEFLKRDGCTVMLGVPTGWRNLERDAVKDAELHELIKIADIVSPWTVGRYRTPEQATRQGGHVWEPDRAWCEEHGLDFLPVVFPGFSWHNLTGEELGSIPRLGGRFLWSQMLAAKRAGCEMIYLAMFDEVDEGTAIFKCTNNPPRSEKAPFLDYEGLPGDFYLRLTGLGGQLLRGEIPESEKLPISHQSLTK